MDPLLISSRRYRSRLLMGTGKFSSLEVMGAATAASGAQVVTVALRRVDLDAPPEAGGRLTDHLPAGVDLLPNTSGAVTADEAVLLAG
ncbi:MAG TPA: thiazole synthase, partial [Kineosporiaceae bacterium]|nr:thiazole synthase [Kineosporiaceae bacterium]